MITLTIANQKGGVGKTTTAVTLAHGLALAGKQVLLVDLDPQGQCATALGLKQEPGVFNLLVVEDEIKTLVRPARERLWLLPGNKRTGTAQNMILAESRRISHLTEKIVRPLARNGLEYVIFDTAPSVGGLQEMAIWASDWVLIPCATNFLSAEGLGKIIETLAYLQAEKGWAGRTWGILPTFFDDTTREAAATLADLLEAFGEQLLKPVHRATILEQAAAQGKTIFETDSKSRAAVEYAAVVRGLIKATK